jgi:hypothetical protein
MSLRTRLLISYLLIVAVFMCIISLALLLVTGVQRTIVLQRLEATADASLALALRSRQLADLPLERVAEMRNVRLLLTDVQGQVLRACLKNGCKWAFCVE